MTRESFSEHTPEEDAGRIEYINMAHGIAKAQKKFVEQLMFLESPANPKPELFDDDIRDTLEKERDIRGNRAGLEGVEDERARLNLLKENRNKYRDLDALNGILDPEDAPTETDIDAWGMLTAMRQAAQDSLEAMKALEETGKLQPSVSEALANTALSAANRASLSYLAGRSRRLTELKMMFKPSSKPENGSASKTVPESVDEDPDSKADLGAWIEEDPDIKDRWNAMTLEQRARYICTVDELFGNS